MSDKPTSFDDFERDELLTIAVEEFGVEVEKEANKKEILAALAEDKVEWQDYVDSHPEVKPEPVKKAPQKPVKEAVNELTVDEVIVTATNPVGNQDAKYLVVMETDKRDNPIFEIQGYRFTSENPYALVTARAAERILREPGFRQAFPSELQEFYS